MKKTLFAISILALIIAGCNSSGGENAVKKPGEDTNTTTVAAASVTDISTSKDIKTLLAQSWENKDDAQEAALSGGSGSFEMPYRGFSFFADGTVVQNPRDDIRIGKWSLDDGGKLVTITYSNGTKAQYTIVKIEAKDMVMANKADGKNIEYRADGKVAKNIADDPFYGANNQWRIKPAKPETNEEIKKRLQQALGFYAKFLEYSIAKNVTAVSFAGIPSVLLWYKGGVAIGPKEKVEQGWINCFYNREQALKAYDMIDQVIGKKYKWDKKEPNWVRQDADGVKQIADTLAATPINLPVAK